MISTFTMLLKLLSGIALFLYGMSVMGDGLKRVAGNKLESLLYKLTSTPLKGILLGAGVTAIIQSSSATSVMVVGFVNSGMMKVAQAIGIIMGANIGTSITGWILCLSYIEGDSGIASLLSTATISAIVAIVGIIFKSFLKKDAYHHIGDIMLGFAVLMMGMQTMSGAVSPLKENEAFVNMFTMFSNPLLGIIVGIIFTAVLQSASASIGILQALSVTGGISFATAFPITMGIGVGAACPVLISSIGTNKNGKRTALVYLLNDVLGMIIGTIVFYTLHLIIHFTFMDYIMTPVAIALLNTVYRMLTVFVLAPFIKQIEKLVFTLVKDSPEDLEDTADFDLLEERFLMYPALALTQSHAAMNGMAIKSKKNMYRAFALLSEYSEEKFAKVQDKENLIDKYEDKVGTYLLQLTRKELNASQTKEASKFLHTLSDFERIGDHASNISRIAKEMFEKKIEFSEEAKYELEVCRKAVFEIVEMTTNAFMEDDVTAATSIEPLRQHIALLTSKMKLNHIDRLQKGICDMEQGFSFNDMLTNMARIGAHCSNIGIAMIELEAQDFDTHQYLKNIKEMKNQRYIELLDMYAYKYNFDGYVPSKFKPESIEVEEPEVAELKAKEIKKSKSIKASIKDSEKKFEKKFEKKAKKLDKGKTIKEVKETKAKETKEKDAKEKDAKEKDYKDKKNKSTKKAKK